MRDRERDLRGYLFFLTACKVSSQILLRSAGAGAVSKSTLGMQEVSLSLKGPDLRHLS